MKTLDYLKQRETAIKNMSSGELRDLLDKSKVTEEEAKAYAKIERELLKDMIDENNSKT